MPSESGPAFFRRPLCWQTESWILFLGDIFLEDCRLTWKPLFTNAYFTALRWRLQTVLAIRNCSSLKDATKKIKWLIEKKNEWKTLGSSALDEKIIHKITMSILQTSIGFELLFFSPLSFLYVYKWSSEMVSCVSGGEKQRMTYIHSLSGCLPARLMLQDPLIFLARELIWKLCCRRSRGRKDGSMCQSGRSWVGIFVSLPDAACSWWQKKLKPNPPAARYMTWFPDLIFCAKIAAWNFISLGRRTGKKERIVDVPLLNLFQIEIHCL